jgi:hypothetical protein
MPLANSSAIFANRISNSFRPPLRFPRTIQTNHRLKKSVSTGCTAPLSANFHFFLWAVPTSVALRWVGVGSTVFGVLYTQHIIANHRVLVLVSFVVFHLDQTTVALSPAVALSSRRRR